MRLMDCLSAATDPVYVESDRGEHFTLPGANVLARRIVETPVRYVLDDTVAVFVIQTALADCARVCRCLDLVRLPSPLMWVEWGQASCLAAMTDLGIVHDPANFGQASRAGLLIQTDETGRKGEADIVWTNAHGGADMSPLVLEFDLDDPNFAYASAWALRVEDSEPLTQIYRHARFRLRDDWREYYLRESRSRAEFERAIDTNVRAAATDFPFLVALCLILAAHNAHELRPSDLSRLNRARGRNRKPMLLEHTEVHACIDVERLSGGGSGSGDNERAAARLHFVSGHLVRRKDRVFWRRAHMRGDARRGMASARTIHLRASPKFWRTPEAIGA